MKRTVIILVAIILMCSYGLFAQAKKFDFHNDKAIPVIAKDSIVDIALINAEILHLQQALESSAFYNEKS